MENFDKTYSEMLKSVGDITKTKMSELYDLFKYQGYNPRDFFMKLWSSAQDNGIAKETFVDDMKAILVFYVTRGTRVDKGKDKSSKDGKDRLKELKERYSISDGVKQEKSGGGGRTLPADEVTIARIAGCFPQVVSMLMDQSFSRTVVDGPAGLPRGLAWAGAPSVIPRNSEAGKKLYALWLTWAKDFDKQIKGKDNAQPDQVEKYGKIIWESNFIGDKARAEIVKGLANKF